MGTEQQKMAPKLYFNDMHTSAVIELLNTPFLFPTVLETVHSATLVPLTLMLSVLLVE